MLAKGLALSDISGFTSLPEAEITKLKCEMDQDYPPPKKNLPSVGSTPTLVQTPLHYSAKQGPIEMQI